MQKSIHTLRLKGLTVGSVMKLLFIANVMLWVPFCIVISLTSLYGYDTVKWNEEVVTGFRGFLLALAIAGIFCFIGTAITGLLSYLGIRIYSALRPEASFSYIEEDG